jgi:hypothetical protein
MLPLPLQFVIAMMAHAINERMALKLEYLQEEARVLREVLTETTGRKRIPFTDEQRRRLAIKGKALTPDERETCCQLVRPNTILDWFRTLTAQKYDGSMQRRKPGRPRKAADIRELVIRIANDNIGWGYTKIPDECLDHFVIFGERHLRHLLREFCAHYHRERFHQGLGGKLLRSPASTSNDNATTSDIQCRSRLGGLLNFYHREAA